MVIPSGAEIPGTGIKDTILSIIKGNKDHFLLNGHYGIYIWDPVKRESKKSYTNLANEDNKFSEDSSESFAFEDIQGKLWAQYEPGILHIIDPLNNSIKKLAFGEGEIDLVNIPKNLEVLLPIFQNLSGIWFLPIGSQESHGFLHFEFETNSFTYYDPQFNDSKNSTQSSRGFF